MKGSPVRVRASALRNRRKWPDFRDDAHGCAWYAETAAELPALLASNSIPNATAKHSDITYASSASVRHPTMFRDNQEHDPESEFSLPPALDQTIRVVMCTSGSPDDIAGRVQASATADPGHVVTGFPSGNVIAGARTPIVDAFR
jgi:hypothetical protein